MIATIINYKFLTITVKPVLSSHSKKDKTKVLIANGSLMKVESIAECSPWSILQYFWPSLSDNRSWKPILVYFLSGRLRQVVLYIHAPFFYCTFIFNWVFKPVHEIWVLITYMTGFIQARLCHIQGLLKDFPTVFKDWKLKTNTDLHVKIPLLKC